MPSHVVPENSEGQPKGTERSLTAGVCSGSGSCSFKKKKKMMSTLLSDHYLENSCGNVQLVPKIMGTVSWTCLISESIALSNSSKSSV